jgi:hypothetical protein
MPEDYDDRLRRHEAIIEGLARLWERQGEMNDEQRTMNARFETFIIEQRTMNARMEGYIAEQRGINAAVASTLARVETLLERLPRGGENGRRDA